MQGEETEGEPRSPRFGLRRLLGGLGTWSHRRPVLAIALALLPAAVLGGLALRAPVDLSFTGIIDRDDPVLATYFESSSRHQLGGFLLILLEGPESDLAAGVTLIEETLDGHALIRSVIPPLPESWWLEQLPWLASAEVFDALMRLVDNPLDEAARRALGQEGTGLASLDEVAGSRLVQVRMARDPLEVTVGRWDFFEVEEIVLKAFAEKLPSVSVGFSGLPAVAAQDQSRTFGIVSRLTPLSLIVVLTLFWLIERRLVGIFVVVVPLLVAVVATLGAVTLLTNGLTIMETFFGVTVFGLGIDFAVHLLMRLREERRKDGTVEEAVRRTYQGTGRGVVAGGATTAGAFLILSVPDDPMARHLGLAGGLGLLFCLLAMLVLMPAFWRIIERREGSHPESRVAPGRGRWLARPIAAGARLAVERPWSVLAVSGLLLGISLLGLARFRYETNLMRVFNRDVPAVQVVERVQERYSVNGAPWIVGVPDLETARRVAGRFEEDPAFEMAVSLASFVPEPGSELERRRNELLRIAPKARQLAAMASDLGTEALATQFNTLVDSVGDGVDPRRAAELALEVLRSLAGAAERGPPTLETLPPGIVERFRSPSGDLLLFAYAEGDTLDGAQAKEQREAAQRIDPRASSLSILLEVLMLGDRPWIPKVAVGILAFVAMILLADFGSPRVACLALVPVLMGTALTAGLLCWVGMPFNVMTLGVLPLLMGLGVDDGIHVLHRVLESTSRAGRRDADGARGENGPIADAAAAVGRAIAMTTATTCSSFGVLMLTNHPGLESMALVMLIGLPICLVASVTTLPALARLVL